MLGAVPMANSSHKAFGTAHVPRTRVCEDFGDAYDGFATPGCSHDRSNLYGLSGANYFVNPEHIVPHEIGGLLNSTFVRERKRFLYNEIDAINTPFTCIEKE